MENKTFVIVLLLAAAGLGIIYFLTQSSAQENEQVRRSSPPQMDSTLNKARPSFEAQQDTEETNPKPPPVEQKYAPGTAEVRVRIDSVFTADQQPESITVTVQQVNGYGPSTPPVATGTELRFGIKSYMENHPEQSKRLVRGQEVTIVIASKQGMQMEGDNSGQQWSFIKLKE